MHLKLCLQRDKLTRCGVIPVLLRQRQGSSQVKGWVRLHRLALSVLGLHSGRTFPMYKALGLSYKM